MVTGAVRDLMKWAAFQALGSGPVLKAKMARIRKTNALTILNLHRVAPEDESAYRPLSPILFDQLLTFIKKHFEPVTFSVIRKVPTGHSRPPIILSFDDGYADFADHAAPLLRKHGIRVNHNIIPDCVERGIPPLNVLMQDFAGRAPMTALNTLEVPGFRTKIARSRRAAFGHSLSAFIKSRSVFEQDALASVLLPQVAQVDGFRPTAMMTREQIRDLSTEHEFGAHSYSHASLGYESDDYLREDVIRCREWFDRQLGQEMRIYAVPNGSYRESQLDCLRDGGIDDILLVDEDFSSAGSDVHRRFTFDARSAAEMRFRATGGFRWPG